MNHLFMKGHNQKNQRKVFFFLLIYDNSYKDQLKYILTTLKAKKKNIEWLT